MFKKSRPSNESRLPSIERTVSATALAFGIATISACGSSEAAPTVTPAPTETAITHDDPSVAQTEAPEQDPSPEASPADIPEMEAPTLAPELLEMYNESYAEFSQRPEEEKLMLGWELMKRPKINREERLMLGWEVMESPDNPNSDDTPTAFYIEGGIGEESNPVNIADPLANTGQDTLDQFVRMIKTANEQSDSENFDLDWLDTHGVFNPDAAKKVLDLAMRDDPNTGQTLGFKDNMSNIYDDREEVVEYAGTLTYIDKVDVTDQFADDASIVQAVLMNVASPNEEVQAVTFVAQRFKDANDVEQTVWRAALAPNG